MPSILCVLMPSQLQKNHRDQASDSCSSKHIERSENRGDNGLNPSPANTPTATPVIDKPTFFPLTSANCSIHNNDLLTHFFSFQFFPPYFITLFWLTFLTSTLTYIYPTFATGFEAIGEAQPTSVCESRSSSTAGFRILGHFIVVWSLPSFLRQLK